MADIFISYAREDEMRVRELVRALEEKRWSIFWDRRIPAGKTWQSYIGKALGDARCVIVVWSHHSITSEWVIEEANDAKGRGILVPVLLDPVQPPLGFRGIQAADLIEWKPEYSTPHFDQLIQDIAGVLGATPPDESTLPKPAPPEPQPQEPEPIKLKPPTRKKRPNFLIPALIALALAIVVASTLWFARPSLKPPETRAIAPPVPATPKVQHVQGGTADCTLFFDNTNVALVQNNAARPTFTVNKENPSELCGLFTYHWNNGNGQPPGTISLRNVTTGATYGPYNATGTPGQGGAPNVNWTVLLSPRIQIRPGDYEVVDSHPASWSWNATSRAGFAKVWLKDVF